MRKIILLSMVLSSAAILMAADITPLNVMTGNWQCTMTSSINGAPTNTSNYQSCVKAPDLSSYPFTDPKANCTWTVQNSTSNAMDATGTCMPPGLGKVTFTMHLVATDTQDVKGTGQMTVSLPNGSSLNGNYSGSGKWVSASCPAK